MKISLDEDVVKNSKTQEGAHLTLPEILICIVIRLGYNPAIVTKSLLDRGIILYNTNQQDKLLVFQRFSDLVDSVIVNSDKSVPKKESIEDLVTALQDLFPKERKLDSSGIPKYSYRGNKKDIALRLQKFFKIYGNYSYEDIIEVTKKYVESFTSDKTYMKTLQYYIIKDGESQLATELENIEDDRNIQNSDWTNTMI